MSMVIFDLHAFFFGAEMDGYRPEMHISINEWKFALVIGSTDML